MLKGGYMRRFFSPALALVLAAALFIPASADFGDPVDGLNLQPGLTPVIREGDGVFNYTVYARDMTGLTNGDLVISYDRESLEFLSYYNRPDFFDMLEVNDVGGKIYFSFIFFNKIEDSSIELITLTFKTKNAGVYPELKADNIAGASVKVVRDIIIDNSPEPPSDGEPATSPKPLTGDINNDGNITASDARIILRISAKLITPSNDVYKAADVNFDNKVTSQDARAVLRLAAKL